ncbi:hypothetical protein [Litorilituus lipolyticus]|uniref:YceK/YidQ family lipoprotein n=1 Tax=Litorilituus lipolyticus TaxID=2491017 RepID=A0A502KR14_9GAMM|nr:hypothetical protein [Litorilituus lipolyticus]TPH14052.1 hypothetical protein EPA86_13175 [Litorilituus lipolyticus]
MQKLLPSLFTLLCLFSCVAIPVKDESHVNRCELSTDMKTLKIVDVAKETNSYYSVWDYVLSPILVPTTAIISGTYVLVNNTYHLGEEQIKCGNGKI